MDRFDNNQPEKELEGKREANELHISDADAENSPAEGILNEGDKTQPTEALYEETEEPNDNIFVPEAEQTKKRKKQTGKIKKIRVKKYYIIPAVFVILIVSLLVGWQIKPSKKLNVCILDKTILTLNETNGLNKNTLYRKHQGLTWLLNQQKFVKEDGSHYDYTKDYFGPYLDKNGKIEGIKELTELDYVPDVMYVADAYGATDDSMGYFNSATSKDGGFTSAEISVVDYAHESGATVIGEMELFNSCADTAVYNQASAMFGVTPTGWVGRYIFELRDFTDVPDWAPPMYEQQEGVEWQFSGPGILLVSNTGKIIVLEQKTHFESKNLLQIYINDKFKKEFKGIRKVNFYNWFELVESNYGSEEIATFEFNVNAAGMERMKDVSKTPRFAAIIRRTPKDEAPIYYFAADFNDYVSQKNFNKFLFADRLFRLISYDSAGDITNFYWNFYNPLVKKILAQTYERLDNESKENAGKYGAKIENGKFYVQKDGKWEQIPLKALSINASMPGEDKLSSNYNYYLSILTEAAKMKANCIQAKTLLPPEFYRALHRVNRENPDNVLYLIQSITANEGLPADQKVSSSAVKSFKDIIKSTVSAVHGDGSIRDDDLRNGAAYFIDVSQYTLGYIIDCGFSPDLVSALNSNGDAYKGKYYSGQKGAAGYAAQFGDALQSYSAEKYGETVSLGFQIKTETLPGAEWNKNSENTADISGIADNSPVKKGFFLSVNMSVLDDTFIANSSLFGGTNYYDSYPKYLAEVKKNINEFVLATGISAPNQIGSVTEKEQGTQLTAMLDSVENAGYMGGIIADLNDDWLAVSDELYPFVVPDKNKKMWKNAVDPLENTGVLSVEPPAPEKSGLELADDDRLQGLTLSSNEAFLYISLQLLGDIDYTKEEAFIGIDTYQRNDGEYYYAKEFTSTALSGMEYVIRFTDKHLVGLYVAAAYDRNSGGYASKESYSADYRLVMQLPYGGFSKGDGLYYQTGSTIYIRLPWSLLNVTDPSQKIVIDNEGEIADKVKTSATNGFLFSFLIADKETKDELYLFPENKENPGYKVFKWNNWETVNYTIREKDSFLILQNYFAGKK